MVTVCPQFSISLPTTEPTTKPSEEPTADPSNYPSIDPTLSPSLSPNTPPTSAPTQSPLIALSETPSIEINYYCYNLRQKNKEFIMGNTNQFVA